MASLSSSPSTTAEPESLPLQLLCFSHCKQVFSLGSLPRCCPVCQQELLSCHLDIPPFALPTPFMRARDYPTSIVIKPSKGSFLEDYDNKSNLHIAVTDSQGEVVEFDQSGLRRDRSEYWQQCLVVNLAETDPTVADMVSDPDWGEYWDLCLEQTLRLDWSKASYHSEDNNCFTFVLTFLRMLNQHPFTGTDLLSSFQQAIMTIYRLVEFESQFLSEVDSTEDSPRREVHNALQETDPE